jgi:DNA ligase 1
MCGMDMLFKEITESFDKIEKANSRLEMTIYLAELFSKIDSSEIKKIVYLMQGQIAPNFEGQEIGFGEKLIIEGISKATGFTKKDAEELFNKKGDLGEVAEELVEKKTQGSLFREELTLEKVFKNFKKMSDSQGKGSQELKIKTLAELFNSASSKEAKYIARIPLGNIRLGIGDSTIMDAFAEIFIDDGLKNKKFVNEIELNLKEKKTEKREEELRRRVKYLLREKIESAYNIYSDLGEIAEILKLKGLKGLDEIEIKPGTPIRPTAAERLPNAKEIIKKLGKCAVEEKYDGFRVQLSKDGDKIKIFSRQSEDITNMFPEIIKAAKTQLKPEKCFVEGEALAVNQESNEYYPFQITIQRKRKYEVEKKAKEYPLNLFLFDVMYVDGKSMMDKPFIERRKKLGEILKEGDIIKLSKMEIIDNPKRLEEFFEEKISQGLEGIIAKDLNAPYIAGARKFAWIKLKRSYKGTLQDTIDTVIIGYFTGKGKRTKFGLGALLVAIYNKNNDTFESIAKIGTGMSEANLTELEKMLSKNKLKTAPLRVKSKIKPDFWVEPKYVIETRADEITKSPLHVCCMENKKGLALRFPRMINIRLDKNAEQATNTDELLKMFKIQKRVELEGNYTNK